MNEAQKRKAWIFGTLGVFAVIGIAWFMYWLLWGRFYEFTDDAYVNGNMVMITPQIPGIVVSINTDNTQIVPKGRVIIELDKTDYTISLELNKAKLAEMVREVAALFDKVEELGASVEVQKAELFRTQEDFEHRKNLLDSGGVSLEDFQHAEAALAASIASLAMTEAQLLGAIAQVENTTIETHPRVNEAKENLKEAWVNLQRCTIEAPVTGLVAQRTVQVGQQIQEGDPLLAIVPLEQMWVDANYKEVQLTDVRIGQPVLMTADLYGSSVKFHGTVIGIPGGTGSVFSVLPPQNATGNWIKIVQRLPVRVSLNPQEISQYPMRLGLSMEVTVDLHNTKGLMVPEAPPPHPLYTTDIYSKQIYGVQELIDKIIAENSP